MFEDTNQTEMQMANTSNAEYAEPVESELAMEGELFADYAPEDTNEGGEADISGEETVEENGVNQAGETETTPETYKVVFNGQEVALTLDELRTNAQKGMNYDHVYGQLQKLKNSPVIDLFERYAQKNGMSVEEYAQYLQRLENQQKISEMTQQGIPEPAAQRILELEEKANAHIAREAEEARQSSMQKQYMDFLREYPNMSVSDIPHEVWQRVENGMELTAAYALYENKGLKTKVKQQEQNELNRQKSVGPIKSENAEASADAFLEGLFG